jgi:hypothetical protein
MAQPLSVALPPDLYLSEGYTISVAAIDPATGNVVTQVNVQNVTMQVQPLGATTLESLAVGEWKLVPGPVT